MFKIPKWEEDVPKTNMDFGKPVKKKKNKDHVTQQTEKVIDPSVNQNSNINTKKNKINEINVFTVINTQNNKKKNKKRKAKLNKKLQASSNDIPSTHVMTNDKPGKLLLNPNKRKHSETITNEDNEHENKKIKITSKEGGAKHDKITNTITTKVITKVKIPDNKKNQTFIKEDKFKVIESKKVNKNINNNNIVNELSEPSNTSITKTEQKKSKKKKKKNKSESDNITELKVNNDINLKSKAKTSEAGVITNVPNGMRNSKKEKLKKILQMNNRNKINVADSGSKLRQRMLEKLKAAQFRYLNEKLYTSSGTEAKELFQSDPEAFQTYHQGYQLQVKKWPVNPLDVIVKRISQMPKSYSVVDMGCGEAALSKRVGHRVRSFDLVAAAPGVEACDMARCPLLSGSTDVAVYCLALMGTDLTQYLLEANRILKMGGHLLIAEVESRFEKVDDFTSQVERLGFKLKKLDNSHQVFFFMEFVKIREPPAKKSKLPTLSLKPCLYKRR